VTHGEWDKASGWQWPFLPPVPHDNRPVDRYHTRADPWAEEDQTADNGFRAREYRKDRQSNDDQRKAYRHTASGGELSPVRDTVR